MLIKPSNIGFYNLFLYKVLTIRVGDLLEGGVTTGIRRQAIHGSYENLRQLS
ncbi:hypothetical protein [Ureibacillus sp. FSL W8-0352]|uniref:hypothetical protein n=1 Tax=Ureibacillus sp. FSL W8-0352 TaxID=2954596 RepID=UPI0030F9E0BF